MVNRAAFLLMALALSGCLRARFIDERPDLPDLLPPADLASSSDLTGADLTTFASTVATGTFSGRSHYNGEGSAELVDLGNGQFELRFGSDFNVSQVPGPLVYLSSRGAIGSTIDSRTDLFLGALTSYSGAQSYLIEGDPGDRRYAWVYCGPFRVEVALAPMTP
jgi:hypothetical protein